MLPTVRRELDIAPFLINYRYVLSQGVLCFMSHSGDCVERFRFDQKIHSLLLNCGVRMLSIVTQDMFISQFTVTHDGQTMITTSVREGGREGGWGFVVSLSFLLCVYNI